LLNRLELDEAWSFVGKKQKNVLRHEIPVKGDQYVFIGMAGGAALSQPPWSLLKKRLVPIHRDTGKRGKRGQYPRGLFRPLVA
jgi:hypothetical protein